MSDAYSVRPGSIRALSPEGRAWFRATLANVAASDRRIKQRTTLLTIAELNPAIAARHKRFSAWANGGRKAAGQAPEGPRVIVGAIVYVKGDRIAPDNVVRIAGARLRLTFAHDTVTRHALRGADVLTMRRAA